MRKVCTVLLAVCFALLCNIYSRYTRKGECYGEAINYLWLAFYFAVDQSTITTHIIPTATNVNDLKALFPLLFRL